MSTSSHPGTWWRLVRGALAYAMLPMVGLITGPLLARALGPEGRGQLASVLQPLTVADAVLLAGVPTAVTYFIGRGHRFKDIGKSVFVVISLTMIITVSLMLMYSVHISNLTELNRWFVLGVWCTSFLGLLIALRRAVLQGHGVLGRLDAERALFAILRLISIVLLFFAGIKYVEPYILGFLIPGLVAALLLTLPIKNSTTTARSPSHSISPPVHRTFYFYVFFAGSGHIANVLNSRLDQAILPLSLSARDLGMYAVAVTLAEVPLILSAVITRNLLSEASKGLSGRALLPTALIGNVLVALATIILWIVTPWAIRLLFGEEFAPASDVARALLIGTVFASITASTGAVFAGTGHAGKSAIAPVFGVVLLVLGLLAFSQNMTAYTAAIIVMFARVCCSILAIVIMYWTTRLPKGN